MLDKSPPSVAAEMRICILVATVPVAIRARRSVRIETRRTDDRPPSLINDIDVT
jgi:hypothetical protein